MLAVPYVVLITGNKLAVFVFDGNIINTQAVKDFAERIHLTVGAVCFFALYGFGVNVRFAVGIVYNHRDTRFHQLINVFLKDMLRKTYHSLAFTVQRTGGKRIIKGFRKNMSIFIKGFVKVANTQKDDCFGVFCPIFRQPFQYRVHRLFGFCGLRLFL